MLERIPSITAASVALLRAAASLPGAPFDTANDRSLRVLAPRSLELAMRVAGALTARAPALHQLGRALSLGLLDHVALRTRAIDIALLAELATGTEQVVICGAGLDARAFRIPELKDATVLEVDHPATQRLKRARIEGRAPTCRRLTLVPVDFTRESLDEKLAGAGHDATVPTVWIWEGVTPYLTGDAIAATLAVIVRRSAPRSLALVTYALPTMAGVRSVGLTVDRVGAPVLWAFGALGEPLEGRMETSELRTMAEPLGLTMERDEGSDEWGRAHLRGEATAIRIDERLAALRKR